jgi:hypothetical protein
MASLRVFALPLITLALCSGCAASAATPSNLPLRILASELAAVPAPTAEPSELGSSDAKDGGERAPRIGAPGGSGAGSRRVAPAQSGKETVGGLPVGMGGCTGPAGRG